jgi:hypothetical protein
VPLFERQEKRSWGYIDLLGIRKHKELCVIELKKEPAARRSGGTNASESPLRMVLEAAAYATALKENWPRFRKELIDCLESLSIPTDKLPDEDDQPVVRLVGAAPASYWIDWLPVTEKGRTVKQADWGHFRDLLKRFEKENMPVSFVSISGDISNPGGLAAQPLTQFPLDLKAS